MRDTASAEFAAFTIESCKMKLSGVSGGKAAEYFNDYGVLDFLPGNYDMLHTPGRKQILSWRKQGSSLRAIAQNLAKYGCITTAQNLCKFLNRFPQELKTAVSVFDLIALMEKKTPIWSKILHLASVFLFTQLIPAITVSSQCFCIIDYVKKTAGTELKLCPR